MICKKDIKGSESYCGTARVLHVLTLVNKHRKRRSKVGNDNPLEGVGLRNEKAVYYYRLHIHTLPWLHKFLVAQNHHRFSKLVCMFN